MTRLTANDRLRRLLSVVPWVASQDGPTIDAICARFDMSRDELLVDLDVVFMVGVHPYTPDALVDVVVENDRVWIHYADFFSRPLRLTAAQGLALVAAGSSLLKVPGAEADGPLARGLAKLAATLGVDPDESLGVSLGTASKETLDLVADATERRRTIELDYYTFGRDQRSKRLVDPHHLYADQGQWYMAAYCHEARGDRIFRLDRVHALRLTDQPFDPPDDPPELAVYTPRTDDPRVVLELGPAARWVADYYPHEGYTVRADGSAELTLAVSAIPWLERLLLRVGPDARVVDPGGLDDGLAGRAAGRILARYRD